MMKRSLKLAAALTAAAMTLTLFAGCGEDADATSSTSSQGGLIIESTGGVTSLPTVDVGSEPEDDGTVTLELVSRGAEFTCLTLDTEDFKAYIEEHADWIGAEYDRADWQTANAPLGDRIGASPIGWGGQDQEPHGLLAVTAFEIEDLAALEGYSYYMDIWYDNTIHMYLNGNLVYSDATEDTGANDWKDDYTIIEFSEDIGQYLVEGTNTVAISLLDGWGGRELDLALIATGPANTEADADADADAE